MSFAGSIDYAEKMRKIIRELTKLLVDETDDKKIDASSLVKWENDMKKLEEKETKLIEEYNQVLSNLYLLPGYVLAVSSGVSGLLSSDPKLCWLLANVVVLVIVFLVALWFAIRFAYRQLVGLQAKMEELAVERTRLYCFSVVDRTSAPESTNPALKKWMNYENKNSRLEFQAQHYDKFLLLIIVCGLMYAVMLLIAGYHVLCDSKVTICLHNFFSKLKQLYNFILILCISLLTVSAMYPMYPMYSMYSSYSSLSSFGKFLLHLLNKN